MIGKRLLENLYYKKNKSSSEIANIIGCSPSKVDYWIKKNHFIKRSISDAVYIKNNPKGDPFKFISPKNINDAILFGIGVGLFWGEGNKADTTSVRLGNTDPDMIFIFIEFLHKFYCIDKSKLKFSLQIFSDMPESKAINFWIKRLNVRRSQFYKTTITPYRSLGTYRQKSKYGVLIVYFHNRKFRDLIMELIDQQRWLKNKPR